MQQRYYDPFAGRMLSTDPIGTDVDTGSSFNRFDYAQNSPYVYIDPDGREAEPAIPKVVITAQRPVQAPTTPSPPPEPPTVERKPIDMAVVLNDGPIQAFHPECALPALRFVCEAAAVSGGALLAVKGVKGVRKKPGSLGQPKGTDALRRENEQARAVDRELGLPPGTTHKEISGIGLSGYTEILRYMRELGYGK
jgi:uncharacterized protein RhaS with RHS repeats